MEKRTKEGETQGNRVEESKSQSVWRWLFPLAGAGICLVFFYAIGEAFVGGYKTAAGSDRLPVVEHMYLLGLWTVFGSTAACLLAVALCRLPQTTIQRFRQVVEGGSDRRWLFFVSATAFLIPVLLRIFVLQGCPLTDDETCYEFLARLLASGRLTAASPPAKLFYDHVFMINDGRFYPQYFVGWPLVMAPFVWLGIAGFANAFCCAATVPGLYSILKTVAGRTWARRGLMLYLVSPLLMIGAATQLSHTSCILVLVWMIVVFMRIREGKARAVTSGLFFALFCLAFLIRPTAALGIGLPFLVAWLLVLRRGTWRYGLVAFSSGALVSVLGATIFLGINYIQTGSAFVPAYQRYVTYSIENGCRFSYLSSVEAARQCQVVNMDFGNLLKSVAMQGVAVFRMNYALFGWPCSLIFVLFGLAVRRASLFSWSLLTFAGVHFFLSDVGVDPFGPVHFTETAIPLIVLTVAGLARLARFRLLAADHEPPVLAAPWPWLLALALCIVSLVGYIPIHLETLYSTTSHISRPFRAVKALDAGPAVIFTVRPFAPCMKPETPRHFVFFPPVNGPDFDDQKLWVNHISVADDRRFMQLHPGRTGFVLFWLRSGDLALIPLADLSAGDVPNGQVGGSGEGPDWAAIKKEVTRGSQ